MPDRNDRKFFKNFFIKKSIQLSIIAKIVFIVFASSLVTTLVLAFIYYAESRGGSFYYMSHDVTADLKLQNILGLILPAILSAQLVGLILALGVGLFSSRKIAVPLYKIERWAGELSKGKLNTRLAFRENTEMRELTTKCNSVTDMYRNLLSEIRDSVEALERDESKSASVAREVTNMKAKLQRVEFE